ncbi:MAG TPA: DNA-3-methyladenine glycosylase 2 family protein [Burkholderiales bacterium]|nr:DNA-3-methyladenine glycosylase 2 family protein [Burkholderiales bacterium]
MTPSYWNDATGELARRDPVLRILIRNHDGPYLQCREDAFSTLARSIIGEQISVQAAESVWEKLLESVGALGPAAIVRMDPSKLRACGLSSKKSNYLIDLAEHFIDGSLAQQEWGERDDEQLIAELTKVKGIGRWTAEMFLIFFMMRPDILPADDIGLQRAMSLHYNNGKPLSKLKIRQIAIEWQPWRTVATWYLWRSLDPIPVGG